MESSPVFKESGGQTDFYPPGLEFTPPENQNLLRFLSRPHHGDQRSVKFSQNICGMDDVKVVASDPAVESTINDYILTPTTSASSSSEGLEVSSIPDLLDHNNNGHNNIAADEAKASQQRSFSVNYELHSNVKY